MKRLLLLTVLLGFSFQGFSQDNNEVKASEKVKDTLRRSRKMVRF